MNNLFGIEKFFLDSYTSWDELDLLSIQFNGVKLKESVFTSDIVENADCLVLLLDICKVEVYDYEGEVIYSGEITDVTIS